MPRADVTVATLMMIDSLEMTDADRQSVVARVPSRRRRAVS